MADDATLVALVERTALATGFSGVVRVDRAGRTAVRAAFGLADRRHGIANTPAARFGIASGTKGFTALTVMRLVADDVFSLETTARSLLGGDLTLIDDDVTVRHLLAHRSGIGDYIDESSDYDVNDYVMPVPVHELAGIESYLSVLDGHPQRERPGETFRYNNGGFVVLSLLAERAARRPFAQLVEELVVRPAGLTATRFDRSDEIPGDVAIGYLHDDGLRSNVLHLPVQGSGDGGIVTSAADMHALWQALFDDRIVPGPVRRSMIEPLSEAPKENLRYGLGFWLEPDDAVSIHGFDTGVGFVSVHDPNRHLTLSVLSNKSRGAWPCSQRILQIVNGG